MINFYAVRRMEHDDPRVAVPAIVGVLWRPLDDFNGYGLTRSGYLYWMVQRLNQETATFMWMYECEGALIFQVVWKIEVNQF